jgi:septal ring factor EnvC (AmiA/AmiB activator)
MSIFKRKRESSIESEENAELQQISQELAEIQKSVGSTKEEEKKIDDTISHIQNTLNTEEANIRDINRKLDEVSGLSKKEAEIKKLRKQLLREIEEEEA